MGLEKVVCWNNQSQKILWHCSFNKTVSQIITFAAHLFYKITEVGTRNFFLSPQSKLRNLNEARPQSQFHNFLKNVSPEPQLRNSAIAIFSEVLNFTSATWELYFRNFRQIFGVEQLEIIFFLPPGVFSYCEDFEWFGPCLHVKTTVPKAKIIHD